MRSRGSILILVMFVLIVVSLLAVSLAYRVGVESRTARGRALHAQLRAQAASAAAIAIARVCENTGPFDHPSQPWHAHPPLYAEEWLPEWAAGAAGDPPPFLCDYEVVDEEGKLPLLKASGPSLEKLGMSPEQIAALFDWMDGDDDVRAGGAEGEYYLSRPRPYRCKNAPAEVLEELLLVRGISPADYRGAPAAPQPRPGLVRLLTCVGDGRINLNTCPRAVLDTLPLSEGAARQVESFRRFDEMSTGKLQDHVFTSADDVDRLQGLSPPDKAVLKSVGRFKSEHYRVMVTAVHRPSGLRAELEVLFRAKPPSAEVLQWRTAP